MIIFHMKIFTNFLPPYDSSSSNTSVKYSEARKILKLKNMVIIAIVKVHLSTFNSKSTWSLGMLKRRTRFVYYKFNKLLKPALIRNNNNFFCFWIFNLLLFKWNWNLTTQGKNESKTIQSEYVHVPHVSFRRNNALKTSTRFWSNLIHILKE